METVAGHWLLMVETSYSSTLLSASPDEGNVWLFFGGLERNLPLDTISLAACCRDFGQAARRPTRCSSLPADVLTP